MSGAFNPAQRNFLVDLPRAGGAIPGAVAGSVGNFGNLGKAALSGALTANTYKQMLNLTGPGALSLLVLTAEDDNGGASRYLSVQIVIDGVTVLNSSVQMAFGGASSIFAVGGQAGGLAFPQPLGFKSSCVVSIKSDVTETNKSNLIYAYRLG